MARRSVSEMLININVNDGVTSSLDNINRKIKATETYLRNSNKIVRDNDLSYEGLKTRIADTSKIMELNNQKIAQLTAKKLELERANDTESSTYYNIVNSINTIVAKNENYKNSIDSLTERKLNLANRTNELADTLRNIDLEMNRNSSNARALGDNYGEVNAQIEGTRQKFDAVSVQLDRQRTLIADLTNQFGEHSRQVEVARQRYIELETSQNNYRNTLREMSRDTFTFRNVLMNTSQAVGVFADDFSNKTEFLGIMFKGAFIGAIASTITAVVPLMAQLGGIVVGGVASIANSIGGLGLGAIISKSLFSGVLSKSNEIDTLNEQINSFKGNATGATKANSNFNKSLNNTNKIQQSNNKGLQEKERIQSRIKVLEQQINAEAEKERRAEELARYKESRNTYLENKKKSLLQIRDIEKEINALNKDRAIMEEQANQKILKSELALVNQKIKSSKYDAKQTQELITQRDNIMEAIANSEKSESDKTLALGEKKLRLEEQKKQKLQEIANIQKNITKLDKEYAKSNDKTTKDKLEGQRKALEEQLSKITSDFKSNPDYQISMPEIDTGSIGSGDNGLADLIKQRDELLNSLSPVQKQFLDALENYKTWYSGFIQQFEKPVFGIAITGLSSIKNILIASIPIINGALTAVQNLGNQFNSFTASDEFKNLMADLGSSVQSDIERMGQALGNFGLGFGYFIANSEPLKDLFLTFIEDMSTKFLNFMKTLDENEAFQSFVQSILDNKDEIGELFTNFGLFIEAVLKFANEYGEEVIKALNDILPLATEFVTTLTDFFSSLPEDVQSSIAKFTLFGGILTAIGVGFLVIVKPVGMLLGSLLRIAGLGGALKKALDVSKVKPLLDKIPSPKDIMAKMDVKQIGSKVSSGFKTVAKIGGKALLPLQAVLSGIDFFKGFTDAKKTFELEADEVPTIGQKVASGLGSVFSGLTFGLLDSKTVSNFIYDMGTKIKEFGEDIGEWIMRKIAWLIAQAKGIFFSVTAFITTFVTNVKTKATEMATAFIAKVNSIKTKAVEKFNEIKNKVTEFVSNVKTKATEMATTFIAKVNSIKTKAVEKFNEIKNKVTEFVSNIKTKATEMANTFKSKVDSIKDKFVSGFNNMKEKASSIISTIKGYFTSFGSKVSSTVKGVKDKFTGMVTTMKDKFLEVKDKAIGIFKDIGEGAKKFVTEDIPNKLKDLGSKFADIGKEVAQKFLDGFTKIGDKIKDITGINFIASKFANGTKGKLKQDTLAMVNDGYGNNYEELIIRPDGSSYIPSGRNVLTMLEKGSQVIKGSTTRKILDNLKYDKFATGSLPKAVNNNLDLLLDVSKTAKEGRRSFTNTENNSEGEISIILKELLNETKNMKDFIRYIAKKNPEIILNGKLVGKILDEEKSKKEMRNKQARGGGY